MSLADDMLHDLFSKLRQYARVGLGRIVGSTSSENGAYKELLSLSERAYFLRVEVNALTKLLIDKGVFTVDEWQKTLADEALALLEAIGKQWPEIEVAADHFTIKDVQALARRSKREGWPD